MDRLFYEIKRRSLYDNLQFRDRNLTIESDGAIRRTKNPKLLPRDVLEKQFQYNGQQGSLNYTKDTSIRNQVGLLDKYGNDLEIGINNNIWNSLNKKPIQVSGYQFDNKYIQEQPISKSSKLIIKK